MSELQKADKEVSDDALACISPYLTEHINRFGDYTLNMQQAFVFNRSGPFAQFKFSTSTINFRTFVEGELAMKSIVKNMLLLVVFSGALSLAQNAIPTGTFSHIIIIVQENRTPDNIFGSTHTATLCNLEHQFETGVDIEAGGYGYLPNSTQRQLICDVSLAMNNLPLGDPDHTNVGWNLDYDSGNMDGFCHEYNNPKGMPPCPSYTFVQKSDVQPYFDLATGYGFANYLFQTNEGPSYEAHQFLFSGTSAAVAPKDPNNYYIDFVAENAAFSASGCPVGGGPNWVLPTGVQENDPRSKPNECYTHDSLVTNTSGDKGVSWRYYTPTKGVIWDAPEAIPEVCYGQNKVIGGPCNAQEFTTHIALPNKHGYDSAPILDDIANCNLQKISWVIPDQAWSDHPAFDGTQSPPYGPSWVGDIVDAIGNSYRNSQGACDYWGYPAHADATPEPTAIFVVWDDWGGLFDHVLPPAVYRSNSNTNCPTNVQQNGWGCGYVYGFRVPMLAISEYTQAGYVSGACTTNCPNEVFPYVHDFGSVLAFTEYNFGLPFIDLPDKGYADYNAPDWGSKRNHIPLSDFFSLSSQRDFTHIPTPFGPDFFRKYYTTLVNGVYPTPTGPDGTSGEEN